MKKIIIISDLIAGGVEKVNTTIAENIDSYKYEVTIVSITNNDEEEHRNENFKYRSLNIKNQSRAMIKLIKIFKEIKPDVIITCSGFDTYYSLLYTKIVNIKCKCIYIQHSVYSKNLDNKNIKQLLIHHYFSRIINIFNKCDAIVYVSQGVKDDFEKYYKIDEGKSNVIYNPIIDKDVLIKLNDNIKKSLDLITIGRLESEKNQIMIIKALKIILDKGYKARLCILGEGSLKEYLLQEAIKLGIENSIEFKGYVNDVNFILKEKDIFLLTSKHESFGNVIVEAMNCGVPVISTDCPCGPREIIGNNEYGYLVNIDDIDDLVNKIIQISLSDNTGLILKAKEHSKKFTVKQSVIQYEKLIDRIVME